MALSARIDNPTMAVLCLLLFAFPVHELGHLLALRLLGKRGKMGGGLGLVVKMPPAVQGWRMALVAAAGPSVNLLAMWLALKLGIQTAAQVNFVLAAVNLLPILPLDGGRIVLGLLSGAVAWRRLAGALLLSGRAAAIALALCVYYFGLTRWLMPAAAWLYLLSMMEERRLGSVQMAALSECVGQGARPLRHVRIKRDMPLYLVMRRCSPGWRNVVYYKGGKIDGDWLVGRWQSGYGARFMTDLLKD